jgi:hypothetical protein
MAKLVSIFFSHAPTMGYVFRSGRVIHFIGGQYTTSVKGEIEELTDECEANPNGNYYVKPDQLTVDQDQLDPMAVLYAKMMEKARSEVAASINPARDMGETTFDGLKGIANSSTVRGLVQESSVDAGAPTTKVAAGTIKVAGATVTK